MHNRCEKELLFCISCDKSEKMRYLCKDFANIRKNAQIINRYRVNYCYSGRFT